MIKILEKNKDELVGAISQVAYSYENMESSKPVRQEICQELRKCFFQDDFVSDLIKWWSENQCTALKKLTRRSQESSLETGPLRFMNEFVTNHINQWTLLHYQLCRDNLLIEKRILESPIEISVFRFANSYVLSYLAFS